MIEQSVKWVLCLATLFIIALAWLFLDTRAVDKGTAWRFGEGDPIRNLFYTKEGRMHPEGKRNLIIFLAASLLLMLVLL